ncbi:MAG: hypothetical protein A07HR67_00531 [uncultured archaeon A07HR67]|nr:MAG: hypothetical protein A07HR67_00531 [uncultured archaeon A07HR67]
MPAGPWTPQIIKAAEEPIPRAEDPLGSGDRTVETRPRAALSGRITGRARDA